MRCESIYCDFNDGGVCRKESISLDMDARCYDFACGGISRYDDEPHFADAQPANSEMQTTQKG